MQAFHQQGADEIWGNLLGGAGEEAVGEVLAMAKATPAAWLWRQGSWRIPVGFG